MNEQHIEPLHGHDSHREAIAFTVGNPCKNSPRPCDHPAHGEVGQTDG